MKRGKVLVLLVTIVVLGQCGCGGGTKKEANPLAMNADAELLLREMIDAYRNVDSYLDRGSLRMSYRQDGVLLEDRAAFSVVYAKPNRFHVQVHAATMVSDGKQFFARITDELTNDIDGQVVVKPAPPTVDLASIYQDRVLDEAIRGGRGRHPIQLELLFGEQALSSFLEDSVQRSLLANSNYDDQVCRRVSVLVEDGEFVFWIDAKSHLLRKLEFPTKTIQEEIGNVQEITEVQLFAEFHSAQLNGQVTDDEFVFELPGEAKQVQRFVKPPLPLPSELFGKQPPPFSFTDLQGAEIQGSDLGGKLTVLMWFYDHPACQVGLAQLQQVYEAHRDREEIRFIAVCTAPQGEAELGGMSSDEIEALLERWNISLPVVRDLEAFGRDAFGILDAPTLIVLDAEGSVQVCEVGGNPDLAEQLPTVIELIQSGTNVADTVVSEYRRQLAEYQAAIAGDGATSGAVIDLEQTPLQPKTDPENLQLTTLWNSLEVVDAGNILVVEKEAGIPSFIVNSGTAGVVEMDTEGKVEQRVNLETGGAAAVSYLRTAVDGSGNRFFAASSLLGPKCWIFDQAWQLVLTYPPQEESEHRMHDIQLTDMNGDGELELNVGFWGVVGVHSLNLEGSLHWRQRTAANVISLLGTTPDAEFGRQALLFVGEVGTIRKINFFGREDPETTIEGRLIHHLYAGNFGADAATRYCGISYAQDGGMLAIGLSDELLEMWSVELAAGSFDTPIQFVSSGQLIPEDPGQWVFAGPDGSVRIVGHDGLFFDAFNIEEYLTGIAVTQIGNQHVLLWSTAESVSAHSVQVLE
ncbi:MAG: redoxin domain-containing protein [Pirellulaceae bacterium]|nr:redoxin domain-containing protein [Pirellulaceae bacterium]